MWPPREWSKLEELPTDPKKLIPAITGVGTSSKPISDLTAQEWYDAYFMLGEPLKWPVLPQGLRPAAYKALALVAGVKAIPGVKDSAGRTGRADFGVRRQDVHPAVARGGLGDRRPIETAPLSSLRSGAPAPATHHTTSTRPSSCPTSPCTACISEGVGVRTPLPLLPSIYAVHLHVRPSGCSCPSRRRTGRRRHA
ncbi:hypothetical protein GCM10017687_26660 [Streptomyces echinatus]